MTEIVLKEESYRIVGACFEVYKVPLEETYERTWSLCPQPMREHVLQLA